MIAHKTLERSLILAFIYPRVRVCPLQQAREARKTAPFVLHQVECFSERTNNASRRYDSRRPTSTYASRAGCILRACPPLPWTAVGRTSHANMQGGGRCVAVGIRSFSRARTCPGFIVRQLLRLCPEILFGRPKMKCIVLTSEGLSVSLGFSFCSGKEMLSTAELLDEQSTLLLLSTKRNDA